MKMAVLYHSVSGNTKTMAEVIAEGMQSVAGVAAKAFSVDDVDEAWVKESKCVVVGTPIYLASVSGKVKSWLEGPCKKCELAGKIGGAFATADYVHGGGELGIRTILDHMMVLGAGHAHLFRRRRVGQAGYPPGACCHRRPFGGKQRCVPLVWQADGRKNAGDFF